MRHERLLRVSIMLVLCLGLGAQAQTAAPGSSYAKLRPARVHSLALKKSSATQFLAVDRKGRLFLLRGDTMEVFRLRTDGDVESVGRLACKRLGLLGNVLGYRSSRGSGPVR